MSVYNVDWWGNGYFEVNDQGHVEVCPDPDVPNARVDLAQLVADRLLLSPNSTAPGTLY